MGCTSSKSTPTPTTGDTTPPTTTTDGGDGVVGVEVGAVNDECVCACLGCFGVDVEQLGRC